MNILVTGANGQLGNEMRRVSPMSGDRYIFTDVTETEGSRTVILDITDREAVCRMVRDNDVDCIVNCAAYTNVDKAETDEATCGRLNAEAPENLAVAMKEAGGLLVHVSTDYVFGGEPCNTPCREEQTGTPTGVYGRTKLNGERNIILSGCEYVIIRTAWLYSEYGRNFVKTMLKLTAEKPELKVVIDQVGTPTYAYDLALAIMTVMGDYAAEMGLRRDGKAPAAAEGGPSAPDSMVGGTGSVHEAYSKTGIYHYSNEGVCSWYDFTKVIAEMSGHTDCDIRPCRSDEFPSPVKRPAYSVLDKTKIREAFGVKAPYWTDSLKACLANIAGMGGGQADGRQI